MVTARAVYMTLRDSRTRSAQQNSSTSDSNDDTRGIPNDSVQSKHICFISNIYTKQTRTVWRTLNTLHTLDTMLYSSTGGGGLLYRLATMQSLSEWPICLFASVRKNNVEERIDCIWVGWHRVGCKCMIWPHGGSAQIASVTKRHFSVRLSNRNESVCVNWMASGGALLWLYLWIIFPVKSQPPHTTGALSAPAWPQRYSVGQSATVVEIMHLFEVWHEYVVVVFCSVFVDSLQ